MVPQHLADRRRWLAARNSSDVAGFGERVLAGLAIGLVAYIFIVNWLGRLASPFWAFFGGAPRRSSPGLSLGVSVSRPLAGPERPAHRPWIAAGLALFWIFLRISKGTGLFDETIQPGYHFDHRQRADSRCTPTSAKPSLHRYHYAMHFLGAGMMQLGHFAPGAPSTSPSRWSGAFRCSWSALSESAIFRVPYGAVLLAGAWAFAGGSRWLMLLLPSGWLSILEQHVRLTGIASGIAQRGALVHVAHGAEPSDRLSVRLPQRHQSDLRHGARWRANIRAHPADAGNPPPGPALAPARRVPDVRRPVLGVGPGLRDLFVLPPAASPSSPASDMSAAHRDLEAIGPLRHSSAWTAPRAAGGSRAGRRYQLDGTASWSSIHPSPDHRAQTGLSVSSASTSAGPRR